MKGTAEMILTRSFSQPVPLLNCVSNLYLLAPRLNCLFHLVFLTFGRQKRQGTIRPSRRIFLILSYDLTLATVVV